VNRKWIAAAVAAAVTLTMFVTLRRAAVADPASIDPRYDAFVATNYDLDNTESTMADQFSRIADFSLWPGGLFWRPAVTYHPTRNIIRVIGGSSG